MGSLRKYANGWRAEIFKKGIRESGQRYYQGWYIRWITEDERRVMEDDHVRADQADA